MAKPKPTPEQFHARLSKITVDAIALRDELMSNKPGPTAEILAVAWLSASVTLLEAIVAAGPPVDD